MKSVEDLDVVKLVHKLALKTYSTTKIFQERRRSASRTRCAGLNGLNGAKRLNGWNDWNSVLRLELRSGYDRVIQMLSRSHRASIVSDEHEHELRTRSLYFLQNLLSWPRQSVRVTAK